eukprot:6340217-Alexandrium_andersonii.AAC.1
MQSVFYEACRQLDVPAHEGQLLTKEGIALNLYTPVLEAVRCYYQPLLIAAATPSEIRERVVQPKQEDEREAGKRSRHASPPPPP